jgi:uncharacterized integral membrane protein
MATFFTSLIVALWLGAIALLSVQNAQPVSLQFLGFQSVAVPLGLLLTFSVILGMVGMAITLPLWRGTGAAGMSDFEDV